MSSLAQPASPLSIGSLAQLTLSLIAIVGLIFALSWLLRRLRFSVPSSSGDMAVLEVLSVGPRERIALIRVGDAQVLIGIGAAGIVPLTPLATPITLSQKTRVPAFADKLRELMRRPGGST